MNVSDSEVVMAIMQRAGYRAAASAETVRRRSLASCDRRLGHAPRRMPMRSPAAAQADVVFLVTCAIRENAERKIWQRLTDLRALKRARRPGSTPLRLGVLGTWPGGPACSGHFASAAMPTANAVRPRPGCMAERLKTQLLEREQTVDVVAGPDAYRDLPRLLSVVDSGQAGVNVQLSLDETYADIAPVRINTSSVSAYVSIMRGCDNMCSFCIVPFTRGRERSRPASSIAEEVRQLVAQGVREVVLLGQNVNSYRDTTTDEADPTAATQLSSGFRTIYRSKLGGVRFAELLRRVADVSPNVRIRFTSPHPKDFPDEVRRRTA